MLDLHKFIALFNGQPVPEDLIRLGGFQNVVKEQYTESFWLTDRERNGLEAGWSKDPAFLDRIVAIAVANGSGSFYGLWNPDNGTAPAQWPVVIFGDEGGEWVIADNIRELLQLTALDVEPYVDHEQVFFYMDGDEDDEDEEDAEDEKEDDEDDEDDERRGSDAIEDYREWLSDVAELAPIADPEPVIARAQEKWQAAFDAWKAPFLNQN